MRCSDLTRDANKPPRVILLEPSQFVTTWDKRPKSKIAIGLRLISESEETTAVGEAERYVRDDIRPQTYETEVEAYNEALMCWLVGAAICDPNDSTKRHESLAMAEETLHEKVTSKTLRFLYEELERLKVETSPLHPVATDGEVTELRELLSTDALCSLPSADAVTARRFLMFALEIIREGVPEPDDIDE